MKKTAAKSAETPPLYYEDPVHHILVVGVKHGAAEKEKGGREKIREFQKKVGNAAHLALESENLRTFDLLEAANREEGGLSYEQMALTMFGEKEDRIHLLHQGESLVALAKEYGISDELFGLFVAIPIFRQNVTRRIRARGSRSIDDESEEFRQLMADLQQETRAALVSMRDELVGFREINIPSTMSIIFDPDHVRALLSRLSFYAQACDLFSTYFVRVRDERIYHPNLVRLREDCKGKIAAIFGIDHFEILKNLLKKDLPHKAGKASAEILTWDEYVKNLDPTARKSIEMVQELIEKD